MKRNKPISERLIERLRNDGWISRDAEVRFRRLYPGHWQRSSGAWVWTVEGHGVDVGSQWTALQCLEADRLEPDSYGGICPINNLDTVS